LSGNKTIKSGELAYSNTTIGDLISKDTDGDSVPDWEEKLWGTDPTKKETTLGIPDSETINRLKVAQEENNPTTGVTGKNLASEKLTQTDQFSRELFATIATLNQNGQMDQATIDKLSSSLAEHIKNSAPRKVYKLSDLKAVKDDSVQSVKDYNDTLNNIIDKKYPIKNSVTEVLQKFIINENNVDESVLPELDPIIKQKNKIIADMAKMSVPQSLSLLHLGLLNALQRLSENINDIKLYDTDVIVALGGISQYESNTTALGLATNNLKNAIQQKLNN